MAFEILKSLPTRPIRGVLFDMDGLVLDSEKLYVRFWREAAAACGFQMTHDQALRMRAANTRLSQENLCEFFGPDADYWQMRGKRIELMDAYIADNGIQTKPGVHELLDCLAARGIRVAIASSSPPDRIRRHLAPHGLDVRFDALFSGYDVPNGKPAPDIYQKAAAALGLEPEECLALEDAPLGIESAYRANCLPVIIPDLDRPSELTLSQCFARADSLTDVISLLALLDA